MKHPSRLAALATCLAWAWAGTVHDAQVLGACLLAAAPALWWVAEIKAAAEWRRVRQWNELLCLVEFR